MEKINLTHKKELLSGWLFSPPPDTGPERKPAAILIHGWHSSQERMFSTAETLSSKSGMVCLTIDLRAHGESTSDIHELSASDFLDDVVAAYDFLARREDVDPEQIGVIGSSFGGYLAALLTLKRKIEWMVLRAPANYPDHGFIKPKLSHALWRWLKALWLRQPRYWRSTLALKAVHEFPGKILIVESEKDDVIPHRTIRNYINAVSDKRNVQHKILKGAPHSLRKNPELQAILNDIIFEWDRGRSEI